jgi:MFS family permease
MEHKKTLFGLNLSVFMMMLGVGMIMSLLPNKVLGLTGSSSAVSYITSAFALSYVVLQVPVGSLSDRYGFKVFLLIGYLLCAMTGMIYYFSSSATLIFVGRVIQGAGEAPIWALAPALLSIRFPNSKGKAMGFYNASLHAGLTLGPILGIVVLKFWSDDLTFLFYAAACLAGAIVTYFFVDPVSGNKAENKETISIKHIIALTSDKTILTALVGITLYGAGYGLFLTAIPAFLLGIKGCGQTFIQIVFALFYGAISLSQAITGPLSDKLGRERFMIGGFALAAFGIGIFPNLEGSLISMTLTLTSLGLGIFYISSMAFLSNAVPDSLKGTVSGAYYLFWGIGYFAGPLIISRLGELSDGRIGFYVFSVILIIEVIIMASTYNIRLKRTISS